MQGRKKACKQLVVAASVAPATVSWLVVTTTVTATATEATSASAPATTATAATATTTVSWVWTTVSSVVLQQLWWNGLVGLSHNTNKGGTKGLVVLSEERDGSTSGTGSTSSTDSVDVVLNVTWHVVVDNVVDTLDIYKEIFVIMQYLACKV